MPNYHLRCSWLEHLQKFALNLKSNSPVYSNSAFILSMNGIESFCTSPNNVVFTYSSLIHLTRLMMDSFQCTVACMQRCPAVQIFPIFLQSLYCRQLMRTINYYYAAALFYISSGVFSHQDRVLSRQSRVHICQKGSTYPDCCRGAHHQHGFGLPETLHLSHVVQWQIRILSILHKSW